MNLLRYVMIAAGVWLVFPAIILLCCYAQAEYLLINNPHIGPIEALRLSRQKMFGYKTAYFRSVIVLVPIVLVIRYLGGIFTNWGWIGFGIGFILTMAMYAFIFAYFNIATVIFIRSIPEKNVSWNIEYEPGREQKEAEENEAKLRAERRREEMNIARAERMYAEYKCSHDSMRKDGIYREYCELGLSAYREDAIRAGYARELMRRFDGDPAALQDIISISSEYAMSDLTDRALARIQRYGREANIPAAEVLEMAKQLLEMLHSGAFSEDPGFAARKQTDILNLADSIQGRMKDIEPDGEWQDTYREICSMCGMEE